MTLDELFNAVCKYSFDHRDSNDSPITPTHVYVDTLTFKQWMHDPQALHCMTFGANGDHKVYGMRVHILYRGPHVGFSGE